MPDAERPKLHGRIAMNETGEQRAESRTLASALAHRWAPFCWRLRLIGRHCATRADFFRAYLIAFLFWIGVTLGCLALLMLQHLTGGRWALVIRRILEAGTRTLPLMAVAALPLLAGMKIALRLGAPGPDRSGDPGEACLSESGIFRRAHGFLFRLLVHARAFPEQMVARGRPRRQVCRSGCAWRD